MPNTITTSKGSAKVSLARKTSDMVQSWFQPSAPKTETLCVFFKKNNLRRISARKVKGKTQVSLLTKDGKTVTYSSRNFPLAYLGLVRKFYETN